MNPVTKVFTRLYIGNINLCARVALTLPIFLLLNNAFGQNKRMVAIGSSTTAGYVTTSADSSWFGRFSRYYKCQLGIMDASFNLGVPGSGVYAGMPTTSQPPEGRPAPDVANNVSQAVAILRTLASPGDGIVIVNYPSNEYNIYSIPEILTCLQTIYDSVTKAGNWCFITTTQPRNDALFSNSNIKKKLANIKDSTIKRFGDEHTINFWDGLFDPADSSIVSVYSAGDGIHFNDAGHRILFERILAKNVFSVPMWYAAATGNLNVLTSWGSNKDGSGTHPTSFTGDNQVFTAVNNIAPTIDANWTLSGKNIQLIIGDGIKPVVFKIPPAYKVTILSPRTAAVLCN